MVLSESMENKSIIFLATDHSSINNRIYSMLEKNKWLNPVIIKASELEAALAHDTPSLIILAEAFEVCGKIKSNESYKHIKTLMILFDADQEREARVAHADRCWEYSPAEQEGLYNLIIQLLPKGRKRILVADDEEIVQDVISRALDKDKYEIFPAFNGIEAVDMIRSLMPDLILLDINMPGKNGIQVCQEIKENPETARIPVMFVSARTDENVIEKGFDVGADDYLTKPFKLEELVTKVEQIFGGLTQDRKEKVLVVDDSSTVRSILHNGISQQGFRIITACDGEDGLREAIQEKPDIIISDIEMPNMNGFDFCRAVKSHEDLKHTPFIVLTSRDTRGARALGARAGVNAYLCKPFQVDRIVVLIERFLSEKRQKLELERDIMIASIAALAKALDERDPYTRFHSQNVSDYSVEMAKKIGLGNREIEQIRLSGIVHDIGKIGIRDAILLKEGPLTEDEFLLIQEHPGKGASILRPIPSLKPIIPFIQHHHERMDGKGYPNGLKGDNIPLGARIISVADTYDALTTDRPYRKGMPTADAVDIMVKSSGTHLCKDSLEAILQVLREQGKI
ncbi:MAG: response regulator [Nitrospinae bacterium]|nr:response regulator [Nitrospinota bacterium]